MKAILKHADEKGHVNLSDIVSYFRWYYENRRDVGYVVEKKNSIYTKGDYTDKEAERNILANPFKRFEDMNMMRHTKTLGVIEIDSSVWKRLTYEERQNIDQICDTKLNDYYAKLK